MKTINLTILLATALTCQAAETVWLHTLDLKLMTSGWGRPQANKSVTGGLLRIGDRTFTNGVGTHSDSEFFIDLSGQAERFQALVGVDAEAGAGGMVGFTVYGDDKDLWKSGPCKAGEAPRRCDVSLAGVKLLLLVVDDGGNGVGSDHANWADAAITYTGGAPKAIPEPVPVEEAVILTPPAPAAPRINGPSVYGVRPSHPFLYRIPATGERPMTFSCEGLPSTLRLDKQTGIITGSSPDRGEYKVKFVAGNSKGKAKREFRIVSGDKLALTPPMGWNSWYIHYWRVSDRLMREAADVMVSSGMADYGYQYVNIDDCWMMKPGDPNPEISGEPRDSNGRILSNKRFPDMKAMTDYIHAKGLKAGLYISPGPKTCCGFEGAYKHEAQDAQAFADWGFDFLKYDWCSYTEIASPEVRENQIKPYKLMGDELRKLNRDMVFSICFGYPGVCEWAKDIGNSWRINDDLGVLGGSLSRGIYNAGLLAARLSDHAGPGHWNDPDFILIGWVGDAHTGGEGRPTTLTPSEQYTHMSLWCMVSAPLIFSGDMAKLDAFTSNVLCNNEVIDVDQDSIGRQARIAEQTKDVLILVKDMQDGSKAVGLFNLSRLPREIKADWKTLGIKGPQRVRDLWRQKDLGKFEREFQANVPRHGVVLVRIRQAP